MNVNQVIHRFRNSLTPHSDALSALVTQGFPKVSPSSFQWISNKDIQEGFVNFYPSKCVSPWVPLSAKGPWIFTLEKKLVYDMGGYGMLGFGHNPQNILKSLSKEQVMANIMTPHFSQKKFWDQIRPELYSYNSISCLNSGSEINSLAMRIANVHSMANPVRVSLEGSFHGRTENPSRVSHSCQDTYQDHLCDYKKHYSGQYFIRMNDCAHANEVFETIKRKHEFPEITVIEPVQGEGNPGVAIKPEFYRVLRE